ncbi:MAG: sulfotransferase family 2 domain-containing protein [Longimicrobiales bacterium]
MRISHQHRFVFFANPKTGSRSVRRLLDAHSEIHGRPGDQVTDDFPFYNHMRPIDLREVFVARDWDFDDYFKFVLVRNPWSRAVSLYEMIAYREGGQLSRLRSRTKRHLAFRAWLRTLDPDGRGADEPGVLQSFRRFGAYTYLGFAGDEEGVPLVDDVIRLEDIDERLAPIFGRLGLPAPDRVPRVGRGRYRGSYRDYYDDEARALVGSLFGADVQRFDYVF